VQLKDILKEKRRRKFTKWVLFLHDDAYAHRAPTTQKELTYLGLHCLDHPPHSPDLTPLEYHLFPGLNKQLLGCYFSSDTEVIAAAETWLDGKYSDFFIGLQTLELRAKKCIELRMEYVEHIPNLVAVACFLPYRTKDVSALPCTGPVSFQLVVFFYEKAL
jgi:histone-lysine N-methyltransferase SETMAR